MADDDGPATAPSGAGATAVGAGATAVGAGTYTGPNRLDLSTMLLASVAIGIAVTSIMRGIGTPAWVVMAACSLAYSGTGEVAYASVVAAGGGIPAAIAAAAMVSSRFGLLAMSMTGRWRASRLERIGIAHFASEVAVAAAIEQGPNGERAARRAFWGLALSATAGWIIGSGLGLLLGNVVGDTRRIGLDVVFPASFVGAAVNALRRPDTTTAVLLGAVSAVALTPFLPAGLPVLFAAVGGLAALAVPDRTWRRPRPAAPAAAVPASGGGTRR